MTGAAVIWIGAGLVAAGGAWLVAGLRFVRRSRLTDAVVVGYRIATTNATDGTAHTHYFPQFEFSDGAGRRIRAESSAGETDQEWAIGEAVPVRYLPGRPNTVRPDGARHTFVFPALAVCLGVFFVVLGLLQ